MKTFSKGIKPNTGLLAPAKRRCSIIANSPKHAQKALLLQKKAREGYQLIAEVAPASRVAIGEPMGLSPGAVTPKQLVSILKQMGFKYVFDTSFGADITVMEEGHEFIERFKNGELDEKPMFTSCCPGWVELVDKSYPELKQYLSTCKSPHMMIGALVKTMFARRIGCEANDIFMVSIMPCMKKQGEADRPEYKTESGARHVDLVITTNELGNMIKYLGIIPNFQPETNFDDPLGGASASGLIFGRTGGVMQAALRFVYHMLTHEDLPSVKFTEMEEFPGVIEATLAISPVKGNLAGIITGKTIQVKVAVIVGLGNAKAFIKAVLDGRVDHKFIEIMACSPYGCLTGSGQPSVVKDKSKIEQRKNAMNALEESSDVKCSDDNPGIKRLYEEFLENLGSEIAHDLLHNDQD
jgi:NADH-quinone oxidoreductase subunit G